MRAVLFRAAARRLPADWTARRRRQPPVCAGEAGASGHNTTVVLAPELATPNSRSSLSRSERDIVAVTSHDWGTSEDPQYATSGSVHPSAATSAPMLRLGTHGSAA